MARGKPKAQKMPESDGKLYLVRRRFQDTRNSLILNANTYVQTNCINWVRRIGSILVPVENNLLPPSHHPDDVHLITSTKEDSAVKAPTAQPTSEPKPEPDPEASADPRPARPTNPPRTRRSFGRSR